MERRVWRRVDIGSNRTRVLPHATCPLSPPPKIYPPSTPPATHFARTAQPHSGSLLRPPPSGTPPRGCCHHAVTSFSLFLATRHENRYGRRRDGIRWRTRSRALVRQIAVSGRSKEPHRSSESTPSGNAPSPVAHHTLSGAGIHRVSRVRSARASLVAAHQGHHGSVPAAAAQAG